MSQFRDFTAFGTAQVTKQDYPRGGGGGGRGGGRRTDTRDARIERERAEKKRAEDAAKAKAAALELNDFNYPSIGDGGGWVAPKPQVQMNFAKMAGEWQTKDEENAKAREEREEAERVALENQKRLDRIKKEKRDRDNEISEMFNNRFGSAHSREEDTYEETKVAPVDPDGWETVSRAVVRKPKMWSFNPPDEGLPEDEPDWKWETEDDGVVGSIW